MFTEETSVHILDVILRIIYSSIRIIKIDESLKKTYIGTVAAERHQSKKTEDISTSTTELIDKLENEDDDKVISKPSDLTELESSGKDLSVSIMIFSNLSKKIMATDKTKERVNRIKELLMNSLCAPHFVGLRMSVETFLNGLNGFK